MFNSSFDFIYDAVYYIHNYYCYYRNSGKKEYKCNKRPEH